MQQKRKMDCASITEKKDCHSRKDCQWNKETKACEVKEQKNCQDLGKVACKLRTDCTLKTDGTCTPLLY